MVVVMTLKLVTTAVFVATLTVVVGVMNVVFCVIVGLPNVFVRNV